MNRFIENKLYIVLVLLVLTACYPEQDVAPIVPPTNNPVATVTPRASNATSVAEGDTLWFDIVLSAMVKQDIDFAPILTAASTSDASDYEIINGTVPAFTLTSSVGILIVEDGLPEGAETFAFDFDASGDPGYNFQLNMEASNTASASVSVSDYDYSLDWTESTYEYSDGNTYDMCGFGIDLDIYIANADFSVADFGAATGDCPEISSFASLPAGSYDIYVDFYGGEDDLATVAPPEFEFGYTAQFAGPGDQEVIELKGSFTVADAGASTVVGTLTVAADGSFEIVLN